MNKEQRNRLEEECLHYLWDCHEAPEEFAKRVASEPELAKLLEAMRIESQLMTDAASAPAPALNLQPPVIDRAGRTQRPLRFFGRGRKIAAAILFVLFVLAPCLAWAWTGHKTKSLEQDSLRLVVSAPRGVPDGSPASVHVDTWNLAGGSVAAQVDWEAFDADGRTLAQGTQASEGAFDVQIPANLPGLRLVRVKATHAGNERQAEVSLSPDSEAPLVHLSTDKPIYRPGETVFARFVVLNRLSLEPTEGHCHVRIVDAKGSAVVDQVLQLDRGTGGFSWPIPPDLRGGEFEFELRDAKNEFAAESLGFLVRRFESPTLATTIELDRETYSPGESGSATVQVARVTGGVPAGAQVDGSLIVDGASVWSETKTLDVGGTALFEFAIPSVVERGEGRFTCRISDGSVVETQIEPFVIPTGRVEVAFYPEGGW